MSDPQRRRFLIGLAVGGAATVAGPVAMWRWTGGHGHTLASAPDLQLLPPQARFVQPLRLPGGEGLMAQIDLNHAIDLSAQSIAQGLFPGAATTLWSYVGKVGGREAINPLLRARRGDVIDVGLDNRLSETTTIHWHGLSVDEANDGSGLHALAAGQRRRYRLRIDNRAGLYWYHAHPHGRTGVQLQRGLAGLLLIEDEEELALRARLGMRWGERDLPLMISDKQVAADNAIVYKDGADDWIGNRVLVNWTPEPYLEVIPAWYRFRLANVANARLLRPCFQAGDKVLPMQLIGCDGGLLERAWPIDDVFLAPAQRVDVLVDFSALAPGDKVVLRSLEYVAMENEDESGAFLPDPMGDHPGAAAMGDALDLMELRVIDCAPRDRPPARLPDLSAISKIAPLPDTGDWPLRALRLRMDEQGRWFINDWNFHINGHEPAFSIKRGSREVWEIRNSMTSMPHPIHLHGFQFRVLSRAISPPDIRGRQVAPGGLNPQDMGFNDTVVVWPGEIVRLAIDFSQPFTGTQRYMLHCHNLEHEDMGMMLTFAVTD
ncbi:multicopper oxidase family protein [Lysobacter gummosus]|uniref:Multicopper oxidase CueO n=1 Tax=Lysobacter gummosus TaxID=262324 RepID=A0ABY3XBI3_9GAMM|nr:multicopper oxidase domain-containing protein [Lysobacter gummosus]ALN89247.1 multicopper oxidase family protein [Lysobacter gummosus]UNP29929.1 multicopper oxidase domain-containing protein [Lysobacter gummosus]